MPAIDAAARLLRSPHHRREARTYAAHVARRRDVAAAVRRVVGAASPRDRTGPPPGLALPEPTGGRAAASVLPLAPRPPAAAPYAATLPADDPEAALAEHRFSSVAARLAAGAPAAELAQLARAAQTWGDTNPPADGAPGWDAYSVAERIAQWVLLAAAIRGWDGDETAAAPLDRLVATHAARLADRLELRGEATNNHLLNDGRALYLAGAHLGRPDHLDLGAAILRYGAQAMFTPTGFLREGSSQYHLLLCRSYLEVLACARAREDDALVADLHDPVERMVRRAAFLLGTGTLPLIGDVSPDMPPEFLTGAVPGWGRLFGIDLGEADGDVPEAESFPDAGFHRIRAGRFALTVYANPLGHVPAWSHGHGDLGGFVLDHDGAPLIVDCGRASYAPTPLGAYGRSVRSHSAISVDGHEPMVVHAHNGFIAAMVADYPGPPPRVDVDATTLRLEHHGFARARPGVTVSRAFRLADGALHITDRVDGAGTADVETFFHVHPDVEARAAGPVAAELGRGRRFVLRRTTGDGGAFEHRRGWFSPRYGEAVPTTTLRLARRVQLPAEDTFVLEERP